MSLSSRIHLFGSFIIAVAVTIAFTDCAAASTLSKHLSRRKEYRTVSTDAYTVGIQKSGRVDIRFISGAPVFANVYPMVWLEGEPGPKPLAVSGRLTMRQAANDRLGQGQGMLFVKKDCRWSIRTYVTKPYLAAQVVFVNTTRKPVKVKMLLPWCVGGTKPGVFSLGPRTDAAVVLENGRQAPTPDKGLQPLVPALVKPTPDKGLQPLVPALVKGGSCESVANVTVYNPMTRQSLVAGFLTHARAFTRFRLERSPKAPEEAFDLFQAQCIYDPPVEVAPDGQLMSELLYLSVNEQDPHAGLERYAAATAAVNKVSQRKPFLPHGWDTWSSAYAGDITEAKLIAALDFMDARLKRYGWTHLTVGRGWQREIGDWEPDPERFPHGMKWLADQIHARGMTAGLWLSPFLVHRDAPVAQEHPDWLARPDAGTRGCNPLSEGYRILDVSVPGAADHVAALCQKVVEEWGFDAVVDPELTYPLLGAVSHSDTSLTRVDVVAVGLQAVRLGLGRSTCLLAGGPSPLTGVFAQAVQRGASCVPVWRATPDAPHWGCVEALRNAAHRYYLAPYLGATDTGCVYFGHPSTRARWGVGDAPELTWNQRLAWLTGAAMMGGVLRIGDDITKLTEQELAVLTKLLPTPERPARPLDLFASDPPRIWALTRDTDADKGLQPLVLALFNWDEYAAHTIPVSLAQCGLSDSVYYTVYDFWQDRYHGVARGRLDINVAPGNVRLFGLRRLEKRPMFLATDRHFTQGASDHRTITWDAAAKRLTGIFDAVADTHYNLRILVPEGFTIAEAHTSVAEPSVEMDGDMLKLAFRCAEQGEVTWSVSF